MQKETQCKRLLKHMLGGKAITQGEALALYGIGRLASRIVDLKDRGVDVRSEFVTVETRFGTAKVKNYWLDPFTIKSLLALDEEDKR